MNTQFKKGILELCILSFVNDEDIYGYELVSKLNNYLEVSINSIYPILRRLTNDGMLATYNSKSEEKSVRKYYTITSLGKEYYKKMYSDWNEFNHQVKDLLERGQN